MATHKYRYVGDYAREIDGQTLAPGDFAEFDKSEMSDMTKELVEDGILIDATPPSSAGKSGSAGTSASSSAGNKSETSD